MERAREAGAYAGRAHRLPPWKKERRAHDRHISDVLGNQVVVGLQRARCEARPLGREVCLTVSDVGGTVVACPLHHGVRHVIGVVGRPCNHISQNCPRKSSCAADGCVVTGRIVEHSRGQTRGAQEERQRELCHRARLLRLFGCLAAPSRSDRAALAVYM